MRLFSIFSAAALGPAVIAAQAGTKRDVQICPIEGQQFPKPTGLGEEVAFQNATKTIEDYIQANLTAVPYNETTFSLGMFSLDTEGLIWECHHTDDSVANSSLGAKKANGDSIYRVASMTKVLTVYLWLINKGHRAFSDPITDYIPQLAEKKPTDDYYATPNWEDVTVGDLVTYLAGVARDYGLNDVAITGFVTSLMPATVENLPDDIPELELPVCGFFTENRTYNPCAEDEYIQGISELAASFPEAYTPLYSNANFAILGIALANAMDMSYADVFDTSLVETLGLTGTTSTNPSGISDRAVIPGSDTQRAGWDNVLGPVQGAAGAFSTVNDFASIGKSILNSTLISESATRRWFSSTLFVQVSDQGVGQGWEIFRRKVGIRNVDLYTKSGYWGVYTSIFVLVPDYDFGFTLLTASVNATGSVRNDLPNLIINSILPALEEISRHQANQNFAGTYTTSTSNSSVTIVTDDWPALKVTRYISDGVDLLGTVFALFGEGIDLRLVPNHLYSGNQVGFSAVYQPPVEPSPEDEWYWPCQSWLDIDDFTYGSVPLGQLVFELDETGRARGVELKALRQKLEWQET